MPVTKLHDHQLAAAVLAAVPAGVDAEVEVLDLQIMKANLGWDSFVAAKRNRMSAMWVDALGDTSGLQVLPAMARHASKTLVFAPTGTPATVFSCNTAMGANYTSVTSSTHRYWTVQPTQDYDLRSIDIAARATWSGSGSIGVRVYDATGTVSPLVSGNTTPQCPLVTDLGYLFTTATVNAEVPFRMYATLPTDKIVRLRSGRKYLFCFYGDYYGLVMGGQYASSGGTDWQYYNGASWVLGTGGAAWLNGLAAIGSVEVLSTAETSPVPPSKVILVAATRTTATSDKVEFFVSRDAGATWLSVQPDAVTDLSSLPVGAELVAKCKLTNGGELLGWSLNWR